MKTKLLISVIALFILFSCQGDDDEPSIETIDDPITGYWFPLKSIKEYEGGTNIEDVYIDCENAEPSHLYFHHTIEKYFFQIYKERIDNDNCYYNAGDGNWSKLNENTYQIDIEYYPESDYRSGESSTIVYTIEFINNDIIHVQDQNELLELQVEEPNLVDFYRVFEYHDELFE